MVDSADTASLVAEGWSTFTESGFIGLAGPFFSKDTADGPRFCFPTGDRHRNRNGVVQGGAIMTFADRALAVSARTASGATRTATVQLDFQFIDAVHIGECVEVTPVVVRDTKHLIFMNGTLTVGTRTVAVASGVWKKLSRSPVREQGEDRT